MPKKPALQPELVHEFVNEAHGNLGRVKELLEQEPALLNAAWDWGGGDWETGLGAAAHMGKKDVALHLLAQGARIEVVKAILTEQPDAIKAPGPPLLNDLKRRLIVPIEKLISNRSFRRLVGQF